MIGQSLHSDDSFEYAQQHLDDSACVVYSEVWQAMVALWHEEVHTSPAAVALRLGRPVDWLDKAPTVPWSAFELAIDKVATLARRNRLARLGADLTRRALDLDEDERRLAASCIAALEDPSLAETAVSPTTLAAFLAVTVEYDWIVPGLLERGDRLLITCEEGGGKDLAVSTEIRTVAGWTTMGEIRVGDEVFGPDGEPTSVVAVTEAMLGRVCYQVTFSDGAVVTAGATHQWVTEDYRCRQVEGVARRRGPLRPRGTDQRHKRIHFPKVVTTAQMAATLWARGGHTLNHSIEVCAPLQFPDADLPIDPWLVGYWLGNGTTRAGQVTSGGLGDDLDVHHALARLALAGETPTSIRRDDARHQATVRVAGLYDRLRVVGLLGDKHIPAAYQSAGVKQRLALLQGLMDSDGYPGTGDPGTGRGKGGRSCELTFCRHRLAADAWELIVGLGIKAAINESAAKLYGREVGRRWRIHFQTDLPVFTLPRKAERLLPLRTRRAKLRYVVAVEPVDSVPTRCIQVDRPDGMYLAGRALIPTHNSTLVRQWALTMALGLDPVNLARLDQPVKVLYVDCENSAAQTQRAFAKMLERTGYAPTINLYVEVRTQGLDLLQAADQRWLTGCVATSEPAVLATGPLYKLFVATGDDEGSARLVSQYLDRLRRRFGLAIIIEAHSPHGAAGDRAGLRPFGSSLWMRWPEFGFGLAKRSKRDMSKVEVVHWRGMRDTHRHFPTALEWSTTGFPWRAT